MNSGPIELGSCWAKTDASGNPALTVRDHSLVVGMVAEVLLEIIFPYLKKRFPPGAVTLAALHDVGKLTLGFLFKCPAWKEQWRARGMDVDRLQNSCGQHAWISQQVIEELGVSKLWAISIGGHHGKFANPLQAGKERSGSARLCRPLRMELVSILSDIFGALEVPVEPGEALSAKEAYPLVAAFTGFVILADWLGSDEENLPLPPSFDGPEADPDAVRKLARIAVERRGLVQPGLRADRDFAMLFTPPEAISPYEANLLQEECAELIRGPGLYLIEAPMGMGKTEAALFAAQRLISSGAAHGLYFALPTQLTSNKIHERVGEFLRRAIEPGERADLALAHAASWLEEPENLIIRPGVEQGDDALDPRAARSWFTSRKALLARYGVGTIDQALMGALPVKYAALRLFGLAGKVVVFDEVHTYDAYTSRLLDELIRHLLRLDCVIIILSATLTRGRRESLAALPGNRPRGIGNGYPAITCCPLEGEAIFRNVPYPEDLPAHRVRLNPITMRSPEITEEMVEKILEIARKGGCVLVIRNTVALAQETFSRLQQDGIVTGLLHSRFPFHQRNGHPLTEYRDAEFPEGKEAAWVKWLGKKGPRPPGCILVATQIAEQSLDIDVDYLITDFCPIDLLFQRIGRLWRHMKLRPRETRPVASPECWLMVPELPRDEDDARALKAALMPHAALYAPYILLRTLKALEGRSYLQLPGEIREVIEEVYAPPSVEEPAAWRELREEMETKIGKMVDLAGCVSADPMLPAGSDDEFKASTRMFDRPMLQLVLMKSVEIAPGNKILLHFHSGEQMEWRPGQPWNFAIARAVQLSSVRVPAFQIPKTNTVPEWLLLHSHGPTAAAVVMGAQLRLVPDDSPLPYRLERDRGLVLDQTVIPSKNYNRVEDGWIDDENIFYTTDFE